ncbi:sigma-70 family RNA polymerase sigma factor [Colwellia psychrerythraea]|uniref:RNA polymerase, sigma-24 subunit, RpoE, ECF subfamily n=1 Tax=Colwellia psychrerythraea TaxID=28229 RepID=A0A099L5U8_COLPS|nr:sigma-70 family RNA polymerase sigma factor [Colwellia psychrerythraea]KGJ97522.1 RNA polymerase, sigma-24 subunit, RpoE, ECF subfamily [Colwellia psychrerythraea]
MKECLATVDLAAVFVANRQQLNAIARKIVGMEHIAEDVLQDAYIRLVKGACARKVDKPFSYCCQVVRNIAIDYCRKKKVEAGYREFNNQEVAITCASSGLNIENGMAESQLLDAVIKVIAHLPERTRRVFELHRFDGLTQRQIAEQLGCSAALVNIMIKEAMATISNCRTLYE